MFTFADFDNTIRIIDLLVPAVQALWCFFLGGSIGSFLNVVVYRLPLGLSVVSPPSFCPRCKTPISARDNLPVFGWLLLGGKCRTCREPIAARYPIVEGIAGILLVVLAFAEPLSGGATLPLVRGFGAPQYPLYGMAVYHFALLTTLLGAALMAIDRSPIPRSYWLWALAIGLVPPLIWPTLRPVSLGWPMNIGTGAIEGLVGAVMGFAFGTFASPAAVASPRETEQDLRAGGDAVLAGACLGAYLQWQAAGGIMLAAAVAWSAWQLLRRLGTERQLPWLVLLFPITTVWIVGWRRLAESVRWGDVSLVAGETPWYIATAVAVLVSVLCGAGHMLSRRM